MWLTMCFECLPMHSPALPMQPLKPPNARPCHLSKISLLSNAIPKAIARVLPKVHYLHRPRFEVRSSNTGSPSPLKISQYLLNLAHRKGLAQAIKQWQTMRFFYTALRFTPTQLGSISQGPTGKPFFLGVAYAPDSPAFVSNEGGIVRTSRD